MTATTVQRERLVQRIPQGILDRRLFLLVFFLSGISGLIYQVVWFRLLALTFGVTSYALGIVLAAFMGGLALGGLAGGWLAARARQPLRTYALVEIAIGLAALTVLPLLQLVQGWYVALAPAFAAQPGALAVVRFALAALILLPATIGMGATLPLITRSATGAFQSSRLISQLYAANTAGAVAGVLLAGLLLVGLAGLQASVLLAVVLNLSAGAYLWVAARQLESHGGGESRPTALPSAVRTPWSRAQAVVLWVFGLSGFTALAYEVVWARLISVLSFGVVYGFTLMLAVLLTGIALGSAAYGWWLRGRPTTVWHLVWLELAIGLIVGSSPLWIAADPDQVLAGLLSSVFVVSMLFGATFPAATRLCAGIGPRWSQQLGTAYASNVVGAVLGSLAGGFWLLPTFGAHASLLLLAALNVGAAALLASTQRRAALALAMVAAGGMALAPALLARDAVDVYRAALRGRLGEASAVLWYREGIESSVAVGRRAAGDRLLLVNGGTHTSSNSVVYHRQHGHLAALLHPAPRDVLVIGLGSGITSGTLALYPDLRVHVVELSPGVFEAAAQFEDVNYGVLDSPRVLPTFDDGRNHLLVSGQQYDVIVSETLIPNHAGAGVLYSREFFEIARRALKPGGYMLQWLGPPDTLREYSWTARTFAAAFPHVTYWRRGDLAVGSNEPQAPPDAARSERLLAMPALRQALADAELPGLDALRAARSDPARLPHRSGPLITDDRPANEYPLTLPVLSSLTEGPLPAAR